MPLNAATKSLCMNFQFKFPNIDFCFQFEYIFHTVMLLKHNVLQLFNSTVKIKILRVNFHGLYFYGLS